MASLVRAELRRDLYVPAASVALGSPDLDLLLVHGLAVTKVHVDLQLSMAGTFAFTIPNTFDAGRREFLTARGERALELLTLGTRVWIRMGYGDRYGQTLLLAGYITGLATNFAEGGSPDLEVSGQDALYRLTLGTREHRLEEKTVQEAVAKVASENGFTPQFGAAPPSKADLDSNLQTDLEFLTKLVGNFSPDKKWEFYARPAERIDLLHFGPRRVDSQAVGSLAWGADLLSFKPEASLGSQVSRVEVHGWDEQAKQKIVGEARADSVKAGSPAGASTGAEIQRRFTSRETVHSLRYPVKSKDEADRRAAAELERLIKDHLHGEGETFGFPELLPDTRVRLDGLGAKFSRTLYVTKTTHTYDASGYRTRFSIEEPES